MPTTTTSCTKTLLAALKPTLQCPVRKWLLLLFSSSRNAIYTVSTVWDWGCLLANKWRTAESPRGHCSTGYIQEAHSNREHLKECKTSYLTWAYLLWQEPEARWALRARRSVQGAWITYTHTQGTTCETNCAVTTRVTLCGIMGGTVLLQERLGLQVILRCLPKQ